SRPAGDVEAHRRGPATTNPDRRSAPVALRRPGQMRPPARPRPRLWRAAVRDRRNPKGAWVSRAIAALLVVDDAQDIAFLLAPSARIAIPMRATPCTFTTGSLDDAIGFELTDLFAREAE